MTATDRADYLGRRVVVRYRRPAGSVPPLTDVVGVVSAIDDDGLTVESTAGPVRVRSSDILVVKAVPPAPVRRGRPHTVVSTDDLERLMADGWRAVEEEWLGDWLLRASSGFTRRGNSVLALGDPGSSPASAVVYVEDWYAARRLPSQFQLGLPPTGEAPEDPLGVQLVDRGYAVVAPTVVMTGASSDIGRPGDSAAPVDVSTTLEPEWLAAYGQQRPTMSGVTEQLLTASPGQLFLSTTDRMGEVSAVARLSFHPGWAGLQAMWVRPDRRGHGLGRTVLQVAGEVARQRRISSMYLQVEVDNDPAIGLYRSEGFRTHHRYAYLRRGA